MQWTIICFCKMHPFCFVLKCQPIWRTSLSFRIHHNFEGRIFRKQKNRCLLWSMTRRKLKQYIERVIFRVKIWTTIIIIKIIKEQICIFFTPPRTILPQSDLFGCSLDQDVDGPQHAGNRKEVKQHRAENLPPLAFGHLQLLPLQNTATSGAL